MHMLRCLLLKRALKIHLFPKRTWVSNPNPPTYIFANYLNSRWWWLQLFYFWTHANGSAQNHRLISNALHGSRENFHLSNLARWVHQFLSVVASMSSCLGITTSLGTVLSSKGIAATTATRHVLLWFVFTVHFVVVVHWVDEQIVSN